MNRPLNRVGNHRSLTGLVLEQVHRVTGMVPQQMIGPRSRLPRRVHVLSAKEVGLHVHLLDGELTRLDPLVNPLVTGIEAAHVTGHTDHAAFFLDLDQPLRVRDGVGDRNLDQHVFAGPHHLLRLRGVHLGRTGDDDRLQARLFQRFREVRAPVGNLPAPCCWGRVVRGSRDSSLRKVGVLLHPGARHDAHSTRRRAG